MEKWDSWFLHVFLFCLNKGSETLFMILQYSKKIVKISLMCFSHGSKLFAKKKFFKILSVKKIFFEGVET
jgi:hypothetical protein